MKVPGETEVNSWEDVWGSRWTCETSLEDEGGQGLSFWRSPLFRGQEVGLEEQKEQGRKGRRKFQEEKAGD